MTVDREKALHLLMGRYRYEEAMRLFGEYCLLLEEDWNDFVARHSPIRLRQLHKQLEAVGLWPAEIAAPVARGTGLLKAVTGLLGNLRTPAAEPPAPPAAEPAVNREAEATLAGRDPDQVLMSLVAPAIAIDLPPALAAHAAVGGDASPLHDAIALARYRLAHELGFVFPLVHLRENIELPAGRYAIRLSGETVAEGHLEADCAAALGPDLPNGWPKAPHPTRATMLAWIASSAASAWEGPTQTPAAMLAEHLEEVIKRHAHRLFNNQSLDLLLRTYEPEIGKDTLSELFGRFMSLTELRLVFQAMLKEGYSVRNFPKIVDILMNHYINYLAEKPLSMDETWKISSHIPFFSTEELTRVVCQGLGLLPVSERRLGGLAALERVVREPSADEALRDALERSFRDAASQDTEARDRWPRDPGKGAN